MWCVTAALVMHSELGDILCRLWSDSVWYDRPKGRTVFIKMLCPFRVCRFFCARHNGLLLPEDRANSCEHYACFILQYWR